MKLAALTPYWPAVFIGGAAVAVAWPARSSSKNIISAPPPEAVAVVDGVTLQPTAALRAAVAAYPAHVAGVQIDKRRQALADLWPQIRKALFAVHGAANAPGTRATQPKIDVDQAADIVSAAVQAARAGFAAANYAGDWAPLSDDVALMFRQIELVRFQNGGVADIENDSLSVLGNAYKQAVSAQAILSHASWSGDDLSDLMIQNCTDAAQRLAEFCDEESYGLPIRWPSVLDSLGVGVAQLPDTLANAGSAVVDAATDVLGDALGAVVFSTPVLIGIVAYAWWKLS